MWQSDNDKTKLLKASVIQILFKATVCRYSIFDELNGKEMVAMKIKLNKNIEFEAINE